MIVESRYITLDRYIIHPIGKRAKKMNVACELFEKIKGRIPNDSVEVFEFLHSITVPFEIKELKILDERQINYAFQAWQRALRSCHVQEA
jgi:hypothetical protein